MTEYNEMEHIAYTLVIPFLNKLFFCSLVNWFTGLDPPEKPLGLLQQVFFRSNCQINSVKALNVLCS